MHAVVKVVYTGGGVPLEALLNYVFVQRQSLRVWHAQARCLCNISIRMYVIPASTSISFWNESVICVLDRARLRQEGHV